MVKTLTKIDINLTDNRILLDTILDHLKIFNIDMICDLHKNSSGIFGVSYLPWNNNFTMIFYPKDTLQFIKTRKDKEDMNEIFQMISNIINFNWIDLTTKQQLLVFSIFALFHEVGHIQWKKKLYKCYTKIWKKEITRENITSKKLIHHFKKHERNCEKFKIHHRDKFEEKFCDRFASLMLGKFIIRGFINI